MIRLVWPLLSLSVIYYNHVILAHNPCYNCKYSMHFSYVTTWSRLAWPAFSDCIARFNYDRNPGKLQSYRSKLLVAGQCLVCRLISSSVAATHSGITLREHIPRLKSRRSRGNYQSESKPWRTPSFSRRCILFAASIFAKWSIAVQTRRARDLVANADLPSEKMQAIKIRPGFQTQQSSSAENSTPAGHYSMKIFFDYDNLINRLI